MENKIKVPNKIPCPKCRSGNRLDMDTDYYKFRYTCDACGFTCFGRDLKHEYRKAAEARAKEANGK